jgi:hypothetical protein
MHCVKLGFNQKHKAPKVGMGRNIGAPMHFDIFFWLSTKWYTKLDMDINSMMSCKSLNQGMFFEFKAFFHPMAWPIHAILALVHYQVLKYWYFHFSNFPIWKKSAMFTPKNESPWCLHGDSWIWADMKMENNFQTCAPWTSKWLEEVSESARSSGDHDRMC